VKKPAERARAIDRLRSLPPLRGATDKELGRVDRLTYEAEISPGGVVTKEGESARGFFLIVSGRAIVTVAGLERDALERGMFFGETALLDGAPEPATVTALTPMRLRVANRREFAQLSQVRPMARALLEALAAQERRSFDDGASRPNAQSTEISHSR
jgi:CRP-like cAMP-binding protein